ncbi:MAG: winged helix-turn-helix transcriptional regulator [Acidimicrobiaceae bacterium]|nr:winged helix-turn-helix transcriptional regulator [Acidimicrobiaceae bacterium]
MNRSDPLSLTFLALADSTRRTILEQLATGDASVVEITSAFTLTQPAVTKHLIVLERAGLISRTRDGQRRPARFRIEGLVPVDEWLHRARTEWSDRLDFHLAQSIEASPGN